MLKNSVLVGKTVICSLLKLFYCWSFVIVECPSPKQLLFCLLRGVNSCYSSDPFGKKTRLILSSNISSTNEKTRTFDGLPLLVASQGTMAEALPSPVTSSPDIFKELSPPSKPEDRWPALSQPSSSASSIQPAQKVPSMPASWTPKIVQKCPKDNNKIRERYEKYFQGNRILPIPELVHEVQPKIISYVVTDLKTKRLAGIKKDTFEGLLKAADIPANYYCRRSFATWDVLLPSEDLAAKLAGENVISKYFRLQPEYMGRRKIRITVCNVPIQLNEEVLAAYFVKYGEIEDITKTKSVNGTAHGDYIFTMCLDRGGFTAIPHIIEYENQVMTVVVEGRKPQCWNCKQLGHNNSISNDDDDYSSSSSSNRSCNK